MLKNNFCSNKTLTFTDVTAQSGLDAEIFNSMVSAFGDVDKDGDLDLYVGNYLPNGDMANGPNGDVCDPNHLYLNNNGSFTEIGAQVGVDNLGCTLGTALTDYDGDGDLDIFVINDFNAGTRPLSNYPDRFYRNSAVVNGLPVFDAADTSNITNTETSMGIAIGDYDNDGDLDYYTAAFTKKAIAANVVAEGSEWFNRLNKNSGNGSFTDQSVNTGVESMGSLITSELSTDPYYNTGGLTDFWLNLAESGWGTAFFDADNDGDLDLYVANGPVGAPSEFSTYQPNRLFLNYGNGTFDDAGITPGPPQSYFLLNDQAGDLATFDRFTGHSLTGTRTLGNCAHSSGVFNETGRTVPCYDFSRGLALADYDNDGDVDVFVVNTGFVSSSSQPRLYRNDTSATSTNNWLQIRLNGLISNRRGIGAKIRVTSSSPLGTINQMREINAGSSHASTNAFQVHFGFPQGSSISRLVVEWPMGAVQTITNVALNQITSLSEEDADTDSDGLTDVDEISVYFTDPNNSDTDGDYAYDGEEVAAGSNPKSTTITDSDTDGMSDDWEIVHGLNPLSEDSLDDADADGYANVLEYLSHSDPQNSESIPAFNTIYVDLSNSSGIEDGTLANPFSTLTAAMAAAQDGDTLQIAAGTYALGFFSYSKPVRILGASVDTTILSASYFLPTNLIWSQIENLTITTSFANFPQNARNLVYKNCHLHAAQGSQLLGNSRVVFQNCVLDGGGGLGTGIDLDIDGDLEMINSTLVDYDIGIQQSGSSDVAIRNSILANASVDLNGVTGSDIRYSLVSDGQFAGVNSNISGSPVFADSDYHQAANSPGIDAGYPTDAYVNEPENNGDRINMGAYGNTQVAAIGLDTDGDGLTDQNEFCYDGDCGSYDPYNQVTNPGGVDLDINIADTDGDNWSDNIEVAYGSSPLDPLSLPDIPADGDINLDGKVDAADVVLTQRIILGLYDPTAEQYRHGDVAPLVSGIPVPDGIIDAGDLVAIQRKALGVINF